MKTILAALLTALMLAFASGCTEEGGEPMDTVKQVDLQRFMGDWYVIANIPTFLEKEAYNAIESYALSPDGTIATTFTFNKGGFDGPLKTYHPRGFVRDTNSNALWGMQFIWPIKADFRIVWLEPDYSITVPVDFRRGRYVRLRAASTWSQDATSGRAEVQVLGY